MKKLLLVGAGEAHLYILKQLIKSGLPNVEVALLAPSKYQYYSEMIPEFAESYYSVEDIRIDVQRLTETAGVHWKKGAAMSVDPERKVILTEDGTIIDFDIVSFDIGSLTSDTNVPGVLENARMLKPNYRIPEVVDMATAAQRLVIAGGGTEAVETAFSLHSRRKKDQGSIVTTLVSSGDILDSIGEKASKKAEELLKQHGIDVYKREIVKKVMQDKLVTASNRILPFDELLWVKGPKPQRLFANGGLPIDDEGFLLVEETLQVKRYPFIFGAGDCATLSTYPDVEKGNALTIRQAPVLWENIKGFVGNGNGTKFLPPKLSFTTLYTGNKNGLFILGEKVSHGKFAWKMKSRKDRRFIKQFLAEDK